MPGRAGQEGAEVAVVERVLVELVGGVDRGVEGTAAGLQRDQGGRRRGQGNHADQQQSAQRGVQRECGQRPWPRRRRPGCRSARGPGAAGRACRSASSAGTPPAGSRAAGRSAPRRPRAGSAISWPSIHIRRCRVIQASMARYSRRAIRTAVTAAGIPASSRQGSSIGSITAIAAAVAAKPTTPVSRLTVESTMPAAARMPRSRARSSLLGEAGVVERLQLDGRGRIEHLQLDLVGDLRLQPRLRPAGGDARAPRARSRPRRPRSGRAGRPGPGPGSGRRRTAPSAPSWRPAVRAWSGRRPRHSA